MIFLCLRIGCPLLCVGGLVDFEMATWQLIFFSLLFLTFSFKKKKKKYYKLQRRVSVVLKSYMLKFNLGMTKIGKLLILCNRFRVLTFTSMVVQRNLIIRQIKY